MNHSTGFLKVLCAWTVVFMHSLDAGHSFKIHAAGGSCKARELTLLVRRLVEESLTRFDEINGEHIGTWKPGFPELQVKLNSSLNGALVQCSLYFMDEGLKKILEDQSQDLNPDDRPLHDKLTETISHVNRLEFCIKQTLGGECSLKPLPPQMPTEAFERKQWSHTLLKTARKYLDWLQHKLMGQIVKLKGKHKSNGTGTEATSQIHFEGSGYLS